MNTEQVLPDWIPLNLRTELETLLLEYEVSGEKVFLDVDIPLRDEDEIIGELTILEKAIHTIFLKKLVERECLNLFRNNEKKADLHAQWLKPLSDLNLHLIFSRLGVKPMYLSARKGFLLVKGKKMLEAQKAKLN